MDSYKIIADSGCDRNAEVEKEVKVKRVPLSMKLGDKEFIDDESLDLKEYIQAMRDYDKAPKTACPSPEDYMNACKGHEDDLYVVTLSSQLSGSYNSAVLAKQLFEQDIDDKKNIHIFDSKSAAVGEMMISMKIQELASNALHFEEVVKKVEAYIKEMKTYFVLDNLDHLAKAGRLSKIASNVLNVLNIKLILEGNENGDIALVDKARGQKRAFKKFLDVIGREGKNIEEKILGISHCNCVERALAFKEAVIQKYNFKDIIIFETTGLTTTYADEGGIVIAF